jgi:hypothetical protein
LRRAAELAKDDGDLTLIGVIDIPAQTGGHAPSRPIQARQPKSMRSSRRRNSCWLKRGNLHRCKGLWPPGRSDRRRGRARRRGPHHRGDPGQEPRRAMAPWLR